MGVPVAFVSTSGATSHHGPETSAVVKFGRPVRVLVVGDSIAWSLGLALGIDASRYGVLEQDEGVLGCGVAIQQAVRSQGQYEKMVPDCNSASPPSVQWPAQWSKWISQFHPQVVVVLAGRWETQDVEVNGHWTSILSPGYFDQVRAQLAEAVRVASSGGAHVDLVTSPCFDAGTQRNGKPWPESDPRRVAAYNDAVQEVAGQQPTTVSVFNLDGLVCSGGHESLYAGGIQIRDSDHIHFPGGFIGVDRFGEWIGPRMWPGLLRWS